MMSLGILGSCVLGASACNTGNEGGGKKPLKPLDPVESEQKTTLMFEVDEGLGMSELTTVYGADRNALQQSLHNICEGLSPLKEKYNVCILIYPTWHYYGEGFNGRDPSEPLNRISDDLQYVIEYFGEEGYGVYLELVSSGIDTSQNGEVRDRNGKAKPMPPLHYGDERVYDGLSMDMETLAALYAEYPALKGVRFHELIGSHELGLQGKNHGFIVYEEMLRGIFECVAQTGMHLVWGDHDWNWVVNKDGTVNENVAYWKDWLDMCIDIVGTEHLTLNWNNNGWPAAQYINDVCCFQGYRGVEYGESLQSWFWQELDCGTMNWKPNGTGSLQTKWYAHAANDCPAEVMGAFTLRALQKGAKLIQYEQPQWFFNYNAITTDKGGKAVPLAYTGYYEKQPDYTLTLRAKRLVQMLLDPENADNPSTDLTDYYANAFSDIVNYKTSNKNAKRYYQTVLTAAGGGMMPRTFDVFNSAPDTWTEHSENRYAEGRLGADVAFATRISLTFSAIDETLILRKASDGYVGEFYNYYGGLILTDNITFKDNAAGRVVSVCAINRTAAYESNLEGDPDELLVVREKNGALTFETYKVSASSSANAVYTFMLVKENGLAIEAGNAVSANGYLGSVSLRNGYKLNVDATRPIDNCLLHCEKTASGLHITGTTAADIPLSGEAVFVTTGDIDANFEDELIVLVREGANSKICFFRYQNGAFTALNNRTIDLGTDSPAYLFTTAVCNYLRNY